MTDCCPIVELRRYTLQPGARGAFIELFEREFVEPQEALGMRLIGQFEDLEHPDVFVWIRGFPDMASRATSLAAFYGGPVWKAHRDVANGMMVDSDNVLLLRPARGSTGFHLAENREERPAGTRPEGVLNASVYPVKPTTHERFEARFRRPRHRAPADLGVTILGRFVTEPSPNNFPALPVREGEEVFVSLTWFETISADALQVESLAGLYGRYESFFRLLDLPADPSETVWLLPTPRSLLAGPR